MTVKKPSATEEEYFAREEAQQAKLKHIHDEQATEEAAREARRGTCPTGCATKLVEEAFQSIHIDRCPTCKGVWLSAEEIDQIAPDNAGVLKAAFSFFAGKPQ